MSKANVLVAYVRGDDWEGLYFDGKLKAEGHRVGLREGLLYLHRKTVDAVVLYTPDQAWLEERGSMPKDLADVMLENGKPIPRHELPGQ